MGGAAVADSACSAGAQWQCWTWPEPCPAVEACERTQGELAEERHLDFDPWTWENQGELDCGTPRGFLENGAGGPSLAPAFAAGWGSSHEHASNGAASGGLPAFDGDACLVWSSWCVPSTLYEHCTL